MMEEETEVKVRAYVDVDRGTYLNGRSQSGYVSFLCGNVVSWATKDNPLSYYLIMSQQVFFTTINLHQIII